ncbi:(Na+)-NQR maturation NqrM [Neptunomonas sp.]|uniref:(Na+)-NQR maturation NqrM n=1 Tax=Neptunomonas sp. TaxID=1971898 RepID=UPI0035679C42
MTVFLFSLTLLLTVIVIASIGVMNGRTSLKGSCGGVGAALGEKDYSCSMCGGDSNRCNDQQVDINKVTESYALGREMGS